MLKVQLLFVEPGKFPAQPVAVAQLYGRRFAALRRFRGRGKTHAREPRGLKLHLLAARRFPAHPAARVRREQRAAQFVAIFENQRVARLFRGHGAGGKSHRLKRRRRQIERRRKARPPVRPPVADFQACHAQLALLPED